MKCTESFSDSGDSHVAVCPPDFSMRSSQRSGSYLRMISVTACMVVLGVILALTVYPARLQSSSAPPSQPELVVRPETIRLGISRLIDTILVFEGTGFGATEKVMLLLTDTEPTEKKTLIPLGFGETDQNGHFAFEMTKTMKIYNLLNAEVTIREKGPVLLISLPPVPAGNYRVEATGNDSGRVAYHPLTLAPPSLWDRLKDRMARFIGKIELE